MTSYEDFDPGELESVDYVEVLGCLDDSDIAAYREIVEAKEDVELLGGNVMVELDELTTEALVARARERGIDPGRLASELLRQYLVDNEHI